MKKKNDEGAREKRLKAIRRHASKGALGGITNKEYAVLPHFLELCELAGIKPTKRQASKFRNKRGALRNVAAGLGKAAK